MIEVLDHLTAPGGLSGDGRATEIIIVGGGLAGQVTH